MFYKNFPILDVRKIISTMQFFLIQWKATIIPHSLLFLIDQNTPFYSHKVLRTLPEQASLTLHLLMCPALYASHCGYIKRVACPRAGEECFKNTDESLSVGKGQNGCHIRRPWSDRKMFSSLQPLAYAGQYGHCGVYVYDPYADTITFLEMDTKPHV